jgi:tetratricopeptide (TPR) repeat protein
MSDNNNPVVKMITEVRNNIRKDLYKGKLNYESSVSTLKRHIDVVKKMDEPILLGQIYDTLGTIELERGSYQEAGEYYQQAYDAFDTAQDESRMGAMLNNLGEVYRQMGDYAKAGDLYIRSREIAIRTKRYSLIINTYNNEGQLRLANGEIEEAIRLLNRGLVVNSESGQWSVEIIQSTLPEIHSSLAKAYSLKKDYPAAWENAHRALDIATEFSQVVQMARANQTMAFIAIHDPEFTGDALQFFEQSRSLWTMLGSRVELGRLMALEGEYWASRGDQEHATQAYTEAAMLLDQAQMHQEAEVIRQRLQ